MLQQHHIVDVVTLLLLTIMLLLLIMILCLFMLLVATPYSFGHMVEGKFQISKFLLRFGLAYDIISQMKVLTHASITPCWCSCVFKVATLLLLSRMLLFLRCWKWFDVFVLLVVELYCFGQWWGTISNFKVSFQIWVYLCHNLTNWAFNMCINYYFKKLYVDVFWSFFIIQKNLFLCINLGIIKKTNMVMCLKFICCPSKKEWHVSAWTLRLLKFRWTIIIPQPHVFGGFVL